MPNLVSTASADKANISNYNNYYNETQKVSLNSKDNCPPQGE